jgi:3-methyladenine DNA glycosylase AlkD
MTRDEVMGRLEALGTAQARKTYARHGAGETMFGVSFANLYKLQKQIRKDHALARQLWKTRNLDAQWLATMIADPGEIDSREADDWAKDSQHHGDGMGSFLADLVARSECADEKMRAWTKAKDEFTRAAGYYLLASRVKNGDETLSDKACARFLSTIEREIHGSPNRARYSMNTALIAIGTYRRALTAEALRAAKRIGKVDVDHGNTECKTPDAAPYIKKAVARKKAAKGVNSRA